MLITHNMVHIHSIDSTVNQTNLTNRPPLRDSLSLCIRIKSLTNCISCEKQQNIEVNLNSGLCQ